MSDSESEHCSSSDDEDYVPSGEEYSEDDVNDLVNEDDTDGDDNAPQPQRGKKKNAKSILSRKRKKGVLALGDADHQDECNIDTGECEATDLKPEKEAKVEDEKKKADDLWASFLSDVGQKPKAAINASTQKEEPGVTAKVGLQPQKSDVKKESEDLDQPKDKAKITITKVFDFAGEEVRVTKEVEATSKEGKMYLKQQDPVEKTLSPSSNSVAPTSSSGVKRPGGMTSILGQLGSKKQKMSTLEKSKLDWDTFKEQEGIGEELTIHNRGKEGYIERKAFLERVDHRQFELERDIRLKNMKP